MSLVIDRHSLLVRVPGAVTLAQLEAALGAEELTLGVSGGDLPDPSVSVAEWLARGAPGAPSTFADPADHLVAGLDATLVNGRRLEVRPGPRRAVGPDLVALVLGAGERFATVDRAWLRVHPRGVARPLLDTSKLDLDPPVTPEESKLFDVIARELLREH